MCGARMHTTARQIHANRTIPGDVQPAATSWPLRGAGKALGECRLACLLALGLPLPQQAPCRGGEGLPRHFP